MKKNITRMIAIALVIAAVLTVTINDYSVSAGDGSKYTYRHDSRIAPGGVAAKNKKLIKKVKANAWSTEANPDSDEISVGYACYKIYSTYMKYMEPEYDWEHDLTMGYELKSASETQIKKVSANSKSQKNAVKWFSANDIFESFQGVMTFSKAGTLNAKVKIRRSELVTLFSDVIGRFYPMLLEDLETGSSWWLSKGLEINDNAIYKGIVVGDSLNLDGYATKEDLTRALKNFKLVVKYRIKLNFDNNTNIATSEKEMKAKLKEIGSYFEKKGVEVGYTDYYITLFNGTSASAMIGYDNDTVIDTWFIYLGFDEIGYNRDLQTWYIPETKKFNIVEMLKQVTEIRYKR